MRRLGTLLAVLLVSGTLASGAGSVAPAGAAPLNGRISFTHCDDTGCHVYTANPDGSAIRQLTSNGESFQGDWSPDGKQLAYIGTASGDLALWIANADGSHARQLTPNDRDSDNFWPRFAPGGRRILFINCVGPDCDGGISSVRTDGTHLRHVTPSSGFSYNLADQSTAGGRLAYMRWHVDGVKMAIYVSSADGTNEQRITPPRLQGWLPDWSPAGREIVFTDEVFWDRPSPSLWTVRPNGNRLRPLTDPPLGHSDVAGSYSPDATKVIFDSDRRYGDACCSDLFTVDATGGNVRRVHLPFDAFEARWGTAPLLGANATADAPATTTIGGSPCDNVAELRGASICP